MFKKSLGTVWSLLIVIGLIGVLPAAAVAAPPVQQEMVTCDQEYTVQQGDWLSSIAEQFYGDPLTYPAIVQATNAQADMEGFQQIQNPAVIEVGWQLCIPSQADAMAMLDETGQMMEETAEAEAELMAPEGQMLMVVRNVSKENAPSTFTISGGQFAGGEQFTVNPGEQVRLELDPAEYRTTWSTPATDELSFNRRFTAVPGTVARARIIPEKEQTFFNFNVNRQEMTPEQTQQMAEPEEQLEAPQNLMLLVVNNFSKENAPSTFTISGGQFAGGEQITVNPGEEVVLRLEPAEYRTTWSTPATDELSFNRRFTAVPGTVARARIIPEKEQTFFRFKVNQEQMAQQPTGEMGMEEFPFEAPEGRAQMVVGNRSLQDIPSTLTVVGGRFGGGEQITVNPGEEINLPVDPGTLTIQWSVPIADNPDEEETVIVSREVQLVAGDSPFYWVVPEEFRAFVQTMGEAPTELAQ